MHIGDITSIIKIYFQFLMIKQKDNIFSIYLITVILNVDFNILLFSSILYIYFFLILYILRK